MTPRTESPWPTDAEYRELATEGLVWAAQVHADGGVHHAALFRKLANGVLTLINHLAEARADRAESDQIRVEVCNENGDLKLRVKILERDLNTIRNKVAALVQRLDEDATLLDGYAKNEPAVVAGALDAQAAAEQALFAERRKVTYLRETLQHAALEYPHVGVFQHVLEETK